VKIGAKWSLGPMKGVFGMIPIDELQKIFQVSSQQKTDTSLENRSIAIYEFYSPSPIEDQTTPDQTYLMNPFIKTAVAAQMKHDLMPRHNSLYLQHKTDPSHHHPARCIQILPPLYAIMKLHAAFMTSSPSILASSVWR